MMEPLGLYLHVPFCASKCPYCDFYSLLGDEVLLDAYTEALCDAMDAAAGRFARRADTLYFGGGTPSVLGSRRLIRLVERARLRFGLEGAEITLEANPGAQAAAVESLAQLLREVHAAGVNRLSMGLQSAAPEETAFLGRRHTVEEARHAVERARAVGFENISLDLMLGLPRQDHQTLARSIDFCDDLGAEHLSAYLLKIEEGTAFAWQGVEALCPDDDEQAELYLFAVQALAVRGWAQYEISNFCRPGRESRHNLKYWDSREYLGLGPSAHSFTEGTRWYYPRDLHGFLCDVGAVVREEDDRPARLWERSGDPAPLLQARTGGIDPTEYAMLRLRLTQGLRFADAACRCPALDTAVLSAKAEPLRRAGLLVCTPEGIALTPRGFLLSNAVIGALVL